MKAAQWLIQVKAGANQYFPDIPLHAQVLRETRVKVHIEIGEGIFADLFFREETGRVDYTLMFARSAVTVSTIWAAGTNTR